MGQAGRGGHNEVRGRWAPPPPEEKGSRKGQGQVARGQQAPPATDSNTSRRHANPPPPPAPPPTKQRAYLALVYRNIMWLLDVVCALPAASLHPFICDLLRGPAWGPCTCCERRVRLSKFPSATLRLSVQPISGAAEFISNNPGAFAMILIAAAALCCLLCVLLVILYRRRRKDENQNLDIVWIDPMLNENVGVIPVAKPAKLAAGEDEPEIGLPGMLGEFVVCDAAAEMPEQSLRANPFSVGGGVPAYLSFCKSGLPSPQTPPPPPQAEGWGAGQRSVRVLFFKVASQVTSTSLNVRCGGSSVGDASVTRGAG